MQSLGWLILAAIVFVAGCSTPAERIDALANANHFERLALQGRPFLHISYFKVGDAGAPLHVYVEHDGTPWATPTRPSDDPTPRVPLMLDLMSRDSDSVLYLGRPCYLGTAHFPPCEPGWWTHRRFSPEVIGSMTAALRHFLSAHPGYSSVEFYGYSGGGVIATLMAARFPQTVRLVTAASPLDIDAWSQLHGYSRLDGSLNPVHEVTRLREVRQLHLAGSDDREVPPGIVLAFAAAQPAAEFRVIEGFDHYCCWRRIWRQSILGQ